MRKRVSHILIIIAILVMTASCVKSQFDGNRTGNNSEFIMDFKLLDREDHQELTLNENDTIAVDIEVNAGELYVKVVNENGDNIYKGDQVETGSFDLMIEESGTYTVSVKGKNAKGKVSFVKKEG